MNRVTPSAASRRIGELGRDKPPDPGAQHVRQRQRQTRAGPVELTEELVLGRGAGLDPSGLVRGPRGELTGGDIGRPDRDAAATEHQLGDCLEVDRVGLDAPAALDAALFGDVRRVQLQDLPANRPGSRREQRPVVVPGRIDRPLTLACAGSVPDSRASISRTAGAVIVDSTGPNSRVRVASVTETANEDLPTSTATTTGRQQDRSSSN